MRRWAHAAPRGPVLDVACGEGRHARLFRDLGFEVVALDRAEIAIPGVRFIRADLEDGSPWPLAGQRFAAVVVTNYLHRPLFPLLGESVAQGGILIYETFMLGNERHGRPANPDFLLRPGELLQSFPGLAPLAFEQGLWDLPENASKKAVIQRLCAVRGEVESAKMPPHDHR